MSQYVRQGTVGAGGKPERGRVESFLPAYFASAARVKRSVFARLSFGKSRMIG
jgi:hypothetical protein